LSLAKVKSAIARSLEKYPNRIDLQLKHFAEFMEDFFQNVPVKFRQHLMWSLSDKNIDQPLHSLSEDVRKEIIQFISKTPIDEQREFFVFLWETFADSLGRAIYLFSSFACFKLKQL
jgi:hypothetical protein